MIVQHFSLWNLWANLFSFFWSLLPRRCQHTIELISGLLLSNRQFHTVKGRIVRASQKGTFWQPLTMTLQNCTVANVCSLALQIESRLKVCKWGRCFFGFCGYASFYFRNDLMSAWKSLLGEVEQMYLNWLRASEGANLLDGESKFSAIRTENRYSKIVFSMLLFV